MDSRLNLKTVYVQSVYDSLHTMDETNYVDSQGKDRKY